VHAAEAPDRLAVVSEAGDRTFAELNAHANQLVRALRSRGVEEGSTIALVCSNRPEFVEVYESVLRGAMRLTAINWHLTVDEITYIVDDSEARALIGDVRFAGTLAAVGSGISRGVVRLAVGGAIDGFDSYDDALGSEPGNDVDDPHPGTMMLYTSGTTGRPKGVRRAIAKAPPLYRLYARARVLRGDEHRSLCTGPLYHAAPLTISLTAPLAGGVGVVLMDGWTPEDTLRLIDEHRISHTHLVPTMFHRLLALPDDTKQKYDISSLRLVVHGAAPCPVAVKQQMIEWFGPIIEEYYAATEGGGTYVTAKEWLERPGTVGKAGAGQQVVVRDPDGNDVPAGTIGAVWLRRSKDDPFEYHRDAEKTANAHEGDFFTLGDMGWMDEEGYLFLSGRTAELIISGGVNIYPAEVDAVLLEHPAVADVACVGVPDDDWGEAVKAVVEVREGYEPDHALANELIEFTRTRLAHFKCPRTVDFVDDLPRFETGKIYRRLVRDRYWP
jgi:long-chain acyl-CoA synthetase